MLIFNVLIANIVSAQNTAEVLRSIENYQLLTLPNGFRIQVVTTPEYDFCTCRLTCDVSTLGEGEYPGIKQTVAALTGSDLVAGELIVKTMVSHDKALDSLMVFLHEVMYGNNPTYVNFNDYKNRRIAYLESNAMSLNNIASNAIGLPILTAENLRNITSTNYLEYRQKCFSPERCLLTIVSDADATQIEQLAIKNFGEATKTASKEKNIPPNISPADKVYTINDSTSQQYVVTFKNYYPCVKTPKNYILNKLFFDIVFGDQSIHANSLSCLKYDVNTLTIDGPNEQFAKFTETIYNHRTEGFDILSVLPKAKEKLIQQFNSELKHPDFAAELASELLHYKFPKNYFTLYESAINTVTADEALTFINDVVKKGSCALVLSANQRAIHCTLCKLAKDREVDFIDPNMNILSTIKKGFGAELVLQNHIQATGLNTPPKNMIVLFKSVYSYDDGTSYNAGGKIMRKQPMMYRLDNYIQHSDTTRIFHYKELFDGAIAADSTMLYGVSNNDTLRTKALRQKATFPQEAYYQELGFKYSLHCDYDLFASGYYRIDVTDALGHRYYDYYSVSSGLKNRSEKIDSEGNVMKTILYDYAKFDKYTMPKTISEVTNGLRIDIVFSNYDFKTQWKKTDFQIQYPVVKKKK